MQRKILQRFIVALVLIVILAYHFFVPDYKYGIYQPSIFEMTNNAAYQSNPILQIGWIVIAILFIAVTVFAVSKKLVFDKENSLDLEIAKQLNLRYSSGHKYLLKHSRIFKNYINKKYYLFEGVSQNMQFQYFYFPFTAVANSNSDGTVHCIEIVCKKQFQPVELLNKKHIDFLPHVDKLSPVESDDFNNTYFAYAPDPKNIYYDLDPAALQKLIDIKNSSKIDFTLELMPGRIFVYANSIGADFGSEIKNQDQNLNGQNQVNTRIFQIKNYIDLAFSIYAALA